MDKVYEQLAAKLDELPSRFPRSESGVELRILERIFTPDAAALALQLLPLPESAKAIGHRVGRPVAELRPLLDEMVARGPIGALRVRGAKRYLLMPFVVGIYEFQLPRMDKQLAEMFEEYFPLLVEAGRSDKPALARVVPVNAHIEARAQVLVYEDMRRLLVAARSFNLQPCICRLEKAALGQPCSHPIETCMAFSSEENAYDDTLPAGYGRRVTREDALAVLDSAEREGLVHCTYNVQRDQMFVCNCCSCCCGFLRTIKEFGAPNVLVRSDYVATIDPDGCSSCEECAHGRCPMDAIGSSNGGLSVNRERCIGCGACTVTCPSNAITLARRERGQRSKPSKTLVSWALARTVHRHGVLRGAAQFARIALGSKRSHRGPSHRS